MEQAKEQEKPARSKQLHPDEVVWESKNPGLGHFMAYGDRSIRVRFDDRTLLRLKEGETIAYVLSRRGEQLRVPLSNPAGYQKHVAAALEF